MQQHDGVLLMIYSWAIALKEGADMIAKVMSDLRARPLMRQAGNHCMFLNRFRILVPATLSEGMAESAKAFGVGLDDVLERGRIH